MYAFQTYDAFSVAIKEITSRVNYDNHNIIATCLLYSKSTLPLVIDSDSYRKKTFESHADKLYIRSRSDRLGVQLFELVHKSLQRLVTRMTFKCSFESGQTFEK